MSVPPKVQAGEGETTQLPRGAAAQVNEAAEEGRALAEAAPTAEAPAEEEYAPELEPAEAADYEPQFEASTDDEDFITGPTTRPDEDVTAGSMANNQIPASVRRSLGLLVEAANTPGASENLRSLVNFLVREAS